MKRDTWGSKFGFIMAVAGSSVGLANIWRFPYIVGQNGGAAFIAIYIAFLALIGFPILISEIAIGRRTHTSPSGAFEKLGRNRFWAYPGKLTILTGFIVSGFYSVVAGWIFGYLIESLFGKITSFDSTQEAANHFRSLLDNPAWGVLCHFAFISFSTLVLFFGVQHGIERGNKIMMPLLFVALSFLVFKGISLPHADEALTFLFTPNWSEITPQALLIALGQAFFTLSLGQGTMVTYGSYLKDNTNIVTSCVPIVLMDFFVSILAAIAIFTIVFSVGAQPDSGPTLLFDTLPWVLSQIPGGSMLAIAFFLLVTLAALTSEISAMEPTIAYLRDEWGWSRHKAVLACGGAAFLLGVPSALSYSLLSHMHIAGRPILDFMDFLCSSILIPIGGLFAVIMTGWVWGFPATLTQLKEGASDLFEKHGWLKGYFYICMKFIAPISIVIIFLHSMGLF